MNEFLMEAKNIKVALVPVDLNTAANPGARIKIDAGDRISYVLTMGDSTTATAITFAIKQHDAASAGNSKALSIANPYYHKAAALTSFTKVVPTSASDAIDLTSTFADEPGTVVIEILGENVDVDGGFAWVSVDLTDAGAAKLGAALYIVSDLRYKPGYSQAV